MNRKKGLNLKVKRTRGLYKNSKSRLRRFTDIAVLAVICGGLAFLGYAAGKPIADFLSGRFVAETEETAAAATEPDAVTETESEPAPSEAATEPEPVYAELSAPYTAKESDIESAQSLAALIESVKAENKTAVIIELKTAEGKLTYKSGIEKLAGTVMNGGSLTLAEIYGAFKDSGITPAAKISTLKDSIAPVVIKDVSYRLANGNYSWLDNTPQKGGKHWANPFLDGTKHYIGAVADEITAAGFTDIVLANTVFPNFSSYDISILPSDVSNKDTRFSALTDVYNECAKKVKPIIEINQSDIEKMTGTAEILRGVHDTRVIMNVSRSKFPDKKKSDEENIQILLADAKTAFPGCDFTAKLID